MKQPVVMDIEAKIARLIRKTSGTLPKDALDALILNLLYSTD